MKNSALISIFGLFHLWLGGFHSFDDLLTEPFCKSKGNQQYLNNFYELWGSVLRFIYYIAGKLGKHYRKKY